MRSIIDSVPSNRCAVSSPADFAGGQALPACCEGVCVLVAAGKRSRAGRMLLDRNDDGVRRYIAQQDIAVGRGPIPHEEVGEVDVGVSREHEGGGELGSIGALSGPRGNLHEFVQALVDRSWPAQPGTLGRGASGQVLGQGQWDWRSIRH